MKRLINNLIIKNSGRKHPIKIDVATNHWSLTTDITDNGYHHEEWDINLRYANTALVHNKSAITPDGVIKNRMLSELSWQIYGDASKIISHMYQALMSKNFDEAIKLLECLEDEINGG